MHFSAEKYKSCPIEDCGHKICKVYFEWKNPTFSFDCRPGRKPKPKKNSLVCQISPICSIPIFESKQLHGLRSETATGSARMTMRTQPGVDGRMEFYLAL